MNKFETSTFSKKKRFRDTTGCRCNYKHFSTDVHYKRGLETLRGHSIMTSNIEGERA